MASTTYHWQRFWCERDKPFRLDEQGYLYIWLARQFPHREDPGRDWTSIEAHAVTPREDVAFYGRSS